MTGMLRFKYWVFELVSSLVVVLSFVAYSNMKLETDDDWPRNDVWGFYISLASIVLSLFGILASAVFPRTDYRGSVCRIESILIWLTGSMWSTASVLSIVGPREEDNSVINESYIGIHPNLYFFSLCCLIVSILLIASWFQENVQSGDSLTTTQWILLGSMSFFVTISGIAVRNEAESNQTGINSTNNTITSSSSTGPTSTTVPLCDLEDYNCNRVNLAIILGSVSAGVACIMIPWRGSIRKCHVDVSTMLFTAWFVSVWYLTYESGPGRSFGNIYFGTWAALYLSLNILILSSTTDETRQQLSNPSATNSIGRDDVWEVAYERLDILSTGQAQGGNRRESYGDMFSPAEEWPGMDTSTFVDDGDERQRRSSVLTNDGKIGSSQVQRLEMWSIFGIASAVNLAAMVKFMEGMDGKLAYRHILLIPSMSLVIAVVGFSTCLRYSIVAIRIQGAMILTSIILWVASILSINTFSNHDILGERKVDGESSTLTHANLFFSTWTAVLYSFLLATSWFDASVTSADWVLMFVVSCALMGASVAYIQDTGLEGEKWKVDVLAELYGCDDVAGGCKRVAFGFYLGLISGFLSLVMIVLHRLGPGFHFILGIVVLCGWGGGVGIITFASGRGTAAGTMYFSCWTGLFFSLDITTLNFLRLVQEMEKKKLINSIVAAATAEEAAVVVDKEIVGTMDETGLDPPGSLEMEMPLDLELRIEALICLPLDPEHCVEAPLGPLLDPEQRNEAPICNEEVVDEMDNQSNVFSRESVSEELRSESMFYSAEEDIFDEYDGDSPELVPPEGSP